MPRALHLSFIIGQAVFTADDELGTRLRESPCPLCSAELIPAMWQDHADDFSMVATDDHDLVKLSDNVRGKGWGLLTYQLKQEDDDRDWPERELYVHRVHYQRGLLVVREEMPEVWVHPAAWPETVPDVPCYNIWFQGQVSADASLVTCKTCLRWLSKAGTRPTHART